MTSNTNTEAVLPADQWTPEYIDSLETDLAVEQVMRKVRDKFASENRAKGSGMVAAANATPFLLKHTTQKALAEAWPMANGEVRSSSLLTAYRRCGIALRKLGVTPKDREWNLLANKMGANIAIVGAAIEPFHKDKDGKKVPEEPTREGLLAALEIAFDPTGKKRSAKEIDRIVNPDGQEEDEDEVPEGALASPSTLKGLDAGTKVLGSIEIFLSALGDLTDEEWATAYPHIAKMVDVIDQETAKRSEKRKAS